MKNIENYLEDVKVNGYTKIQDFVSKEEAEVLEEQTLHAFKKANKKFYHSNTDFVKVLSVQESFTTDKKYFKFFNSFFNNTDITNFIKSYFESSEIEISKIFLAESSSTGEKVDVLPYKLHFDKTRYLKFMIYLRDVYEGDGGITFAKKEWNTKLQEELLSREQLKEENIVEVDDLSKIDEVTGPKGTGVIFDTNITHKAGQVLGANKRLVLRIDSRVKP